MTQRGQFRKAFDNLHPAGGPRRFLGPQSSEPPVRLPRLGVCRQLVQPRRLPVGQNVKSLIFSFLSLGSRSEALAGSQLMQECSDLINPRNFASLASASPRARVPGLSPRSGAWLTRLA
jgi:hypothetical protein